MAPTSSTTPSIILDHIYQRYLPLYIERFEDLQNATNRHFSPALRTTIQTALYAFLPAHEPDCWELRDFDESQMPGIVGQPFFLILHLGPVPPDHLTHADHTIELRLTFQRNGVLYLDLWIMPPNLDLPPKQLLGDQFYYCSENPTVFQTNIFGWFGLCRTTTLNTLGATQWETTRNTYHRGLIPKGSLVEYSPKFFRYQNKNGLPSSWAPRPCFFTSHPSTLKALPH